MHAYLETLLSDVRSRVADILEYAVVDCHLTPDMFFALFVASDYRSALERGDRRVALGMSGIEIAQAVLREKMGRTDFPTAAPRFNRTPEYWAGWALAYYQWRSGYTYAEIISVIKVSEIVALYNPYHEGPEDKFADMMDALMHEKLQTTRLARVRAAYGCTQAELAAMSGVKLRNIQMYEQRNNDINHAEAGKVLALARALGCTIEDLLEP